MILLKDKYLLCKHGEEQLMRDVVLRITPGRHGFQTVVGNNTRETVCSTCAHNLPHAVITEVFIKHDVIRLCCKINMSKS